MDEMKPESCGVFIDRGPMSNEALCKEMDNELCRIRYALQGVGYFARHISFRCGGQPCLIIKARAWQKGDEANFTG